MERPGPFSVPTTPEGTIRSYRLVSETNVGNSFSGALDLTFPNLCKNENKEEPGDLTLAGP